MAGRIVPPMINCWFGCGHTEVIGRDRYAILESHDLMEVHYDEAHKGDLDSIFAQITNSMERD